MPKEPQPQRQPSLLQKAGSALGMSSDNVASSDSKRRNKRNKKGKPDEPQAPAQAEMLRQLSDKGTFTVKKEEAKPKTAKEKALYYAEHNNFVALMMVMTFLALFATDLWEALGPPPIESDVMIYTIMLICFILFAYEFIVLSWSKPGYFLSFFWALDFLAALSLIPDVLMVFNIDVITLLGGGASTLTITRAGRAARAGTRAVRIIQVVKQQWKEAQDRRNGVVKKDDEDGDSMIGSRLGDGITEKVIIIVTLMLISSQVFTLITTKTDVDFSISLASMQDLYVACGGSKTQRGCSHVRTNCSLEVPSSDPTCHFNMYFRQVVAEHNGRVNCDSGLAIASYELVQCQLEYFDSTYDFSTYSFDGDCQSQVVRHLSLLGQDLYCNKDAVSSLRTVVPERVAVELSSGSQVTFSNIPYARGQAVVNILQVMFIIVLLGGSSYLFQKDADRLVIGPLGKMAKLVATLSANPLAPIEESETDGEYETDFVERALKKFGKLLQIAFGEAGSEIIGKNAAADGAINPMVAGRKMQAIFGFAILRHFTDCTECLQEEVMLFVNSVADIVHRAVKDNQGAPNKNIGDAFLLAWRLPDDADLSQPVGTIADGALRAFVRSCLECQASDNLRKMTEHPKIQERLPGFRIDMGYGLHVGWAIEGAIGSMLKIDASYLSPNVNLAARLETGTHQFHVDILFSESIFCMLSPEVQELCRKIDRVTVKGSIQPLALYTYDVPSCEASTVKELYEKAEEEYGEDFDFWEAFRPRTSTTYRKRHAQAVEKYLEGMWGEAKKHFEMCLMEWQGDGPSQVIMDYMSSKNFRAPDDWKGCRALTSK